MSKVNLNSMTIDFDDSAPVMAPSPRHSSAGTPEVRQGPDLCFMSLGSGSSGNSAYLGTRDSGIIIDAGINPKTALPELARNGITPEKIVGILLSHDHQDHVRYIFAWLRALRHAQVFCTPRLMSGMLRKHSVQRRIKDYQRPIYKEMPFKVAGMEITAFDTSHDASDNMGFSIETNHGRFVVTTDTGVITERAAHYMRGANFLMIECDYDDVLLEHSHYTEMLKDRIRGPRGHLKNEDAARFVASIYSRQLTHVFLCHLSRDNNSPELAVEVMTNALCACRVPDEDTPQGSRFVTVGDGTNAIDQRDRDVQVYALPRFDSSLWFIL